MVVEVEAVDGDAGVGNEVFYGIISGKLNHNDVEIRRIMGFNNPVRCGSTHFLL